MSSPDEIQLTKSGRWWVARDESTGVASQGETRTEALSNLDEAVALYNSESSESAGVPDAPWFDDS